MLVPRLKPGKRLVPGCSVNGSGGSNLLIFPHYLLGSRINSFFTLVCKDPMYACIQAAMTENGPGRLVYYSHHVIKIVPKIMIFGIRDPK